MAAHALTSVPPDGSPPPGANTAPTAFAETSPAAGLLAMTICCAFWRRDILASRAAVLVWHAAEGHATPPSGMAGPPSPGGSPLELPVPPELLPAPLLELLPLLPSPPLLLPAPLLPPELPPPSGDGLPSPSGPPHATTFPHAISALDARTETAVSFILVIFALFWPNPCLAPCRLVVRSYSDAASVPPPSVPASELGPTPASKPSLGLLHTMSLMRM